MCSDKERVFAMNRVAGLDIFRIGCCLGVIIYHVVDDIFLYQGTGWGIASVFYFGAAYCIPGFFLLSGYLIGKKIRFQWNMWRIS